MICNGIVDNYGKIILLYIYKELIILLKLSTEEAVIDIPVMNVHIFTCLKRFGHIYNIDHL